MAQRKQLGTRPLEGDLPTVLDRLNREHVPFLRQIAQGTVVTGSRSGAPVAILAQVLTILSAAGIITDKTTA